MHKLVGSLAVASIAGVSLLVNAGSAHAVTDGTVLNDQTVGCNVSMGSSLVYQSDPSNYKDGMLTEGGTKIDPTDERTGQESMDSERSGVQGQIGKGYDKLSRWFTTENGVPTMHIRYAVAAEDYAFENFKANMYAPLGSNPNSQWHVVPAAEATQPNDDNDVFGINWTYAEPSSSFAGTYHYNQFSTLDKNTGFYSEIAGPVSELNGQFEMSADATGLFVDKTLCQAPLPKPDSDVAVNGDNNDAVQWPTSVTDYLDNPPVWVNGKETVTVSDPNGNWYHLPDGTWTPTVNVTLTDSGVWPTKTTSVPTTTTVTVPTTTTKTTCTDPSVTVQVDAYTPSTIQQLNTLKADVNRKVLGYRLDGPLAGNLASLTASKTDKASDYASLWGHSTTEFVTLKESVIQKLGMKAAINAATTKMPDLGGTLAVHKTYTDAWVLGTGATVQSPWGAKNTVNQTQWDAATLPAPVCTTSTIQGTTTKQVTTYHDVTTTITPDVAAPIYTDGSVTSGGGGMGA